jgi:tetrahydromethanopterin S-methyltransferase subunit D
LLVADAAAPAAVARGAGGGTGAVDMAEVQIITGSIMASMDVWENENNAIQKKQCVVEQC